VSPSFRNKEERQDGPSAVHFAYQPFIFYNRTLKSMGDTNELDFGPLTEAEEAEVVQLVSLFQEVAV
jgi:hypothetical protein